MAHSEIETAKVEFEKATTFLAKEFAGLQTGRASASLVEDIMVDSYGQKTPIKHLANISIPGSQELMIDPWDKSLLPAVEKAIGDSDLGLSPNNTGAAIRINIPPLTEERRKDIVKMIHQKSENTRVSIRQHRHTAHDHLKRAEKEGDLSEDELRSHEKELQKEVDTANGKVDEITQKKEKEIMTV